MNKLYLILIFILSTFIGHAQVVKNNDAPFSSGTAQTKVVKFYPNPATELINFEFSKPLQRDIVLQVYNFVGKKVYESTNVTQKTIVPLTDFFRGIYIFQLRDKSGRIIESGKFQVNK